MPEDHEADWLVNIRCDEAPTGLSYCGHIIGIIGKCLGLLASNNWRISARTEGMKSLTFYRSGNRLLGCLAFGTAHGRGPCPG